MLFGTGLVVADQSCCVGADAAIPMKQARKDSVVIALRPNVQMDSRVILLSDVALISGGDAMLRDKLKQLDLEDGLAVGESVIINLPQIEFRLRIAGIDVDRISIRGNGVHVTAGSATKSARQIEQAQAAVLSNGRAESIRPVVDLSAVSVGEGPLERELIRAARACIQSKLPWTGDNLDIRLAQPVSFDIRQMPSAEGYVYSAELRTSGAPVGRVQVRVIAQANQRPTFDVTLMMDVRHFDTVVMATKPLERGHVIRANELYADRQDVTEVTDYCAKVADLVGTTTKRSIRPLQPMRMSDIELVSHSQKSIVIKRAEPVRMVGRIGTLSVTAVGEALQDGHVGDVIQLRNIESKATVQGRVTAAGEVEVTF